MSCVKNSIVEIIKDDRYSRDTELQISVKTSYQLVISLTTERKHVKIETFWVDLPELWCDFYLCVAAQLKHQASNNKPVLLNSST
jgi:hypothetical protein